MTMSGQNSGAGYGYGPGQGYGQGYGHGPGYGPAPGRARRPDFDRAWPVAPVIATVLAVPLGFVFIFVLALSPMAFDSCAPGACADKTQAVHLALALAAIACCSLVGTWVWPHTRTFRWVRWMFLVGEVLLLCAAIAAFGLL